MIKEVIKEVIKEIPPKAMLVEVENLKREKQLIWDEREKYRYEYRYPIQFPKFIYKSLHELC